MDRNGWAFALLLWPAGAMFRIRRLEKQKEYGVYDQLRLERPHRCLGGCGELADILVLVPHFCEERTRTRVGMGIIAGKLVAEAPKAYRQGQSN